MSDQSATPKASGWGGKRRNSGRKKTRVATVDLAAALNSAPLEDVESECSQHARKVLDGFVKQLVHGKSDSSRVSAANAILDRAFGKPSVEMGGDPMLPFFGTAPSRQVGTEIREEARKFAKLAIEVLVKIFDTSESESARISAGRSLWDRGLGTVAIAKVPDAPSARPLGKKEEAMRQARSAATGVFATPSPPRNATVQ